MCHCAGEVNGGNWEVGTADGVIGCPLQVGPDDILNLRRRRLAPDAILNLRHWRACSVVHPLTKPFRSLSANRYRVVMVMTHNIMCRVVALRNPLRTVPRLARLVSGGLACSAFPS